jgi:lysophospholipase L1-like esterase
VSITNPGFENDTTGWTTLVSDWLTGITGSVTADADNPATGIKSLKIVLTLAEDAALNGYARATQNITLEANTDYQFRVRWRGEALTLFQVHNADSTIIKRLTPVTGIAAASWKTDLFNFNTGNATAWILNMALSGGSPGNSATTFIDDIEIQKIGLSTPRYTIAAIGDSQVSHLGLNAATENDNTQSWLSASIRKRQTLGHLEVVTPLNAGIVGNNAADVLARLQTDVIASDPALCYVAVGTNDASQHWYIPSFKANIISILQALKAAGIIPVLFTITPRKDGVSITDYNTAITEAAAAESVTLFDANAIFLANADWATEWMDGVEEELHYNAAAHMALGIELGATLEGLLS